MSRARALLSFAVLAGAGGLATACSDGTAPRQARIELEASTLAMYIGQTHQLTAQVFDASGASLGDSVEWKSSDTTTAEVTADGLVTAFRVGQTTITATRGPVHASLPVTVSRDLGVPQGVAVTQSASAIDVGTDSGRVTFTVTAKDDQSGIGSVMASFTPPAGTNGRGFWLGCEFLRRVSGTVADGTWQCTARVGRYVTNGRWTAEVSVHDASHNVVSRLVPLDVSGGIPDTEMPGLAGITIDPPRPLQGDGNPYAAPIQFHVQDGQSGVKDIHVSYRHETATSAYAAAACVTGYRLLLTPEGAGMSLNDYRASCGMKVADPMPRGRWLIVRVEVTDVWGYSRVYLHDDLTAAGLPSSVVFP